MGVVQVRRGARTLPGSSAGRPDRRGLRGLGRPDDGAALADLWHDPGAHATFAKSFVVVVDSFGVRLLPGRGEDEQDRLIARRDLRGVESGALGVAERPTPVAELTVHTQDGRIVLVPLVLTNDGAGGQRPTASFVRRAVGEIKARAGAL